MSALAVSFTGVVMDAVSDPVVIVVGIGAPAEVLDPVVGRVVVPVQADRTLGARTNEGLQHQVMHQANIALAQSYPQAVCGTNELADSALNRDGPAVPPNYHPRQ